MYAAGPTFQRDTDAPVQLLGARQDVQDRINKAWEIRLTSRRDDTHPDINGGKPFTIARYQRNSPAGALPTPEQSFAVFNTLIHETAHTIVVESSDNKESTQYSKEYIKTLYDRHVTGYQSTQEVEDLILESTHV